MPKINWLQLVTLPHGFSLKSWVADNGSCEYADMHLGLMWYKSPRTNPLMVEAMKTR